jgi:hypothetical protein
MTEIDEYEIVGVKGAVYSFAILKLHVALHLLRLNSQELKGLYSVIAKEMVEVALYLLQLCFRLLRERIAKVHAYHRTAVLRHVIEQYKDEVGYEVEHPKRKAGDETE